MYVICSTNKYRNIKILKKHKILNIKNKIYMYIHYVKLYTIK